MDVQSGRATTAPVGEEDVCWARHRVELGFTPGVSLKGARAADWAAAKTTSLTALWREMQSPLLPQPT